MSAGQPTPPQDPVATVIEVAAALAGGRTDEAASVLRRDYPFQPLATDGRNYTAGECMAVFRRDGFIDRYSGNRLVFPGSLRLISKLLPQEFPFHSNWKMDACHFAFYELFPTIDHILPVSRGGANSAENWVSTSMLRNGAKANFTLEELGWTLVPPGEVADWDGLTGWFLDRVRQNDGILTDRYLARWHAAALPMVKRR